MSIFLRFIRLGSIYVFKAAVLTLLTVAFFTNYQLKVQHQKSENEQNTIIDFIKGDGLLTLGVFAIIIVVYMLYSDFKLEHRRSKDGKEIEFYKSLTNPKLTDETRKLLIQEFKEKD